MKSIRTIYEKALEQMEEDYYNNDMSYSALKRFSKNTEMIHSLIKEHFNNSELTLDELKQMKGQPVWNTYLKEWIIVKDIDESFMRTFVTIITKDGEFEITFDCKKLTNFCRKRVE